MGAWIIFSRLLGVIFPLPEMKTKAGARLHASTRGDEGTSLLQSARAGQAQGSRPQVGYGRIVAGEAFELGDDEY